MKIWDSITSIYCIELRRKQFSDCKRLRRSCCWTESNSDKSWCNKLFAFAQA